jgi:hypothetical protein
LRLLSQAANEVDDNMDAPNAYTCGCRCSASPTLNTRVSAALDDVEGVQAADPDGAADLDLGGRSRGSASLPWRSRRAP